MRAALPPEAEPGEAELVALPSFRGPVRGIYHRAPNPRGGVIWLGGFDGGFDGPAGGIYRTLAQALVRHGIASLRLDFRVKGSPGNLGEAIFDAEQGIAFLQEQGILGAALVGHSFGGAVAIAAGVRNAAVAGVVTLSAQTAGAQEVERLSPRPILLIHGAEDRRLPPFLSQYLYGRAGEPKELVILPGVRHSLRQRRRELGQLLTAWLVRLFGGVLTESRPSPNLSSA